MLASLAAGASGGGGVPDSAIVLTVVFSLCVAVATALRPRWLSLPSLLDLTLIAVGSCLLASWGWPWLNSWLPSAKASSGSGGASVVAAGSVAFLATLAYARHKRIPLGRLFDFVVPLGALAVGLQRLCGCFLISGCCYGTPCEAPWAVPASVAARAAKAFPGASALHPTQIYLGLAAFLALPLVRLGRRVGPEGMGASISSFWLSITYVLISSFRGDLSGRSPAVILALLAAVTAFFMAAMLARGRSALGG